ncbi:MotA/TolQ/ExbB proton channel family protein [Brevundimonas sp. TWP2-3-2]|uniref:MotA/TolQ/ExbB proton channel family protein n=1 Tax=unclassified Brevundimonas TaxID=2622653 RepID=UPI003CE69D1E
MPSSRSLSILSAVALVVVPGTALAQGLKPVTIFFEAAPSMKAIILALIIAAIAAVVVTVKKVTSGPHLSGGSTYLSALRLGAPLLGLLGAAFNGLMMFVGLAKFGSQPINVLAPGLAEATFLVVMGLIVGVIAVICHWAVEARVDRAVLRA